MRKKYPIFKTTFKVIGEIAKRDKIILVLFPISALFMGLLPFLEVFYPRLILEEIMNPQMNEKILITTIISFGIVGMVFGFVNVFISLNIVPRTMMVRIEILTETFDKLNKLDYKYTEDPIFKNEYEDAFAAVSSSNTGYEGVMNRLFNLGGKIISIVIFIIMIASLNVYVLIALLISVLITIIVSFLVSKYQYKNKTKLAHASRKIRYYHDMTHDFTYGKDVRLFGFQEKIEKSYHYEIKSYISVFRKIKNKEYFLGFIDLLFVLLSDLVLYYVLVRSVINGMSIPEFSMYLLASLTLSTQLKVLSSDISFIIDNGMYINDHIEFMKTEFNEQTKGLPGVVGDTLQIEFKNVSFKYPKTEHYIIKNLNLKINKGEKLAIIGINGAGKTTLVKLISRLFCVTEGEILVNGVNINDYDKNDYFMMFAPVFQDVNILAFSIRENITLGHSNDEERIWSVLEKVGLKDKVKNLPKGLDTMMLKNIEQDGVIFSGGENQKLMIARALYKDSNCIILDEPTAALDALAEAQIYEQFNKLIEDKTAIFISHRLASTKFCDRIALFKNNELHEYGTHDELMAKRGEYYNMFVVQGQYYQEKEYEEV